MDADALVDAARGSLWVLVQMIAPVVLRALAMGLLALDVLAALWVSGRLGGLAKTATVLLILMLPQDARAQDQCHAFAICHAGPHLCDRRQ